MNRFFKTVLLTGLSVDTTDLVSAYVSGTISSGNFPRKMLYYIAAGALGLKRSL
jgi:hypothetical protein